VVITAATFKEKWEKHVSYNTFVKRKKKQTDISAPANP
jgi:hypothetical protein